MSRHDIAVAEAIRDEVLPAIAHAMNDHGPLTDDHCRAMTILVEEVGEAAANVLAYTRVNGRDLDRAAAITELAQVAAMAILMIVNLEDE